MIVAGPSQTVESASRRSGFSLLEMLIVMWALGIAMMLGAAILAGAIRAYLAVLASQNHLSQKSVLADQFRTDVRQAVSTPDRAEQWQASPTCLVLRRLDGSHVIFVWKDRQLERFDRGGGKAQKIGIDLESTEVEFLRPGKDTAVVTLRFTQQIRHVKAPRVQDVTAALGGDLR